MTRNKFSSRWGSTFVTDDGSFHSFDSFGLLPAARPVFDPAEPKYTFTDIPGTDGGIDRTEELTGYVTYAQTIGTLSYYVRGSDRQRRGVHTQVKRILHGRTVRIILDEEPEYYRVGRIWVGPLTEDKGAGRIEITARVEPFKYEHRTAAEPWLWDPFNFLTGVIRPAQLIVNGTRTVRVISSPRGGSPTVTASAAMTMTYGGKTYAVPAGTTEYPEIELPHGQTEATFSFTGTGTISIDYPLGVL